MAPLNINLNLNLNLKLKPFAQFLKDHKGSGKNMTVLAAEYRAAGLVSMPVLHSTCVGKAQEECTDPCKYILTPKRHYCKLTPEPRTADQKRAAVQAAAATRAKHPFKRYISPEEHERRSESAKRAAAATRDKRRAAGLPQRL